MSIPKIIHYCWFGGGAISPENRKCMESWKKYCPDYKIIEWNEQNFDINKNHYAQQAYAAKKYAFVSDYVRLAVLYEYGGIYLDTDVELVRPLDELLEYKGFIGMEHSAPSPYGRTLLVNTGSGVGAEPGCGMIGKMLAAYRNASFLQETGEPDLRTCTQRGTPLFAKAGLQQKNEQQELDGFLVLPTDCFSPFDYVTERMHRTPRTFGIHYYQGSWQSGDKANRWRKRFKCTRVGRWCMWLRQCSPRWLREKRRSLHNRCRLQWKRWFGCRGLQFGRCILLDRELRLRLNSGSRVTLGDRVESDGRVFITTGYSSQLNIGSGVYFNEGAIISCLGKIDIGDNTLFGPGVKIFDNNHRFSREDGVSRECAAGCITVGRSCWIASDVVLLKGADIGDNCVIGAGCIIRGKVPAGSLVTRSGEQTTRPIEIR